jgi:hypothetical protein
VFAGDVAESLNEFQKTTLFLWRDPFFIFIFLLWRSKEEDLLTVDEKSHKLSLLLLEEVVSLAFHFNHLFELANIVAIGMISISPIYDEHDTVTDLREITKGLM